MALWRPLLSSLSSSSIIALALLYRAEQAFSVEPIFINTGPQWEESPSGLWWAYNRGYPDTWAQISNGLVTWVELDEEGRWEPFLKAIETRAFSYVDTYHMDEQDDSDNDINDDSEDDNDNDEKHIEDKMEVFRVVERSLTNNFDDKLGFHSIAMKAGLEGNIVPRTYTTKDEALNSISPGEVDILFIKDPISTYGKGIQVISAQDLRTFDVPPGHVIQEGLTRNLALFRGARVVVRVHLVMMYGRLYCHHRGFVQVHNEPFDPLSTSEKVQVSHSNYTTHLLDMRLPFRTPPFLDPEEIEHLWGKDVFPLESVANGTKWMKSIVEMGDKLGRMFEPLLKATYENPLSYVYFGVDLIPNSDGTFNMIEINSYPSFRRFDVMTDVILLALQLDKYDPDHKSRLVEVWTLPDIDDSSNDEL